MNIRLLAFLTLSFGSMIIGAMEPPAKLPRMKMQPNNTSSLFKLASKQVKASADCYNPIELIENLSFLLGYKEFKKTLTKTLDLSSYANAQELYQNYLDREKLQAALLEPLSKILADYPELDDTKNIAARVALNAVPRAVRKNGSIINLQNDFLFEELKRFDKFLQVGSENYFVKEAPNLFEFKKIPTSMINMGSRKCIDAQVAGDMLFLRDARNHLLAFKKNEGQYFNNPAKFHADLGLVGAKGFYAILGDGEVAIILHKNVVTVKKRKADLATASYKFIEHKILDFLFDVDTLEAKNKVVAAATCKKLWIWRWDGAHLNIEYVLDRSGDLIVPIFSELKISESGNLIALKATFIDKSVAHFLYRYDGDEWNETELKASTTMNDVEYPIENLEILSENNVIGFIEVEGLFTPVPIYYSWDVDSWNQSLCFDTPILNFYASRHGNQKFATHNQDHTISIYTEENPKEWKGERINRRVLDFYFHEDGKQVIGITEENKVFVLEFQNDEWHEALSIKLELQLPFIACPAFAQPIATETPLHMPIAERGKKLFEFGSDDKGRIFMKTALDNNLYIFQHNRPESQLDLIYSGEGNIETFKAAFSSDILLNNDVYDQETQAVLAEIAALTE